MKRGIKILVVLVVAALLAITLIPSSSQCGIAYIKVQTNDRGVLIASSGLSIGDSLGKETYEAELINIVEKHIHSSQSKLGNPFAPSSYKVSSVIEILIQIKNDQIKQLCIELLKDPQLYKRAPEFLAEIGDQNASPFIFETMLQDEGNDFVYLAAFHTLNEQRAIPLFIDKFNTPYMQKYSVRSWWKPLQELSNHEIPIEIPSNWDSRKSPRKLHAELLEWWEHYSAKHGIEPLKKPI